MNNIPTGKVTFLFTDIEGSTKLSQKFPDTLQDALDIHHSILRKAFESNNGFVFEIIGDAFCCAFWNSEDAVKAAVDAQMNLASEKWIDAVIKVRMGIHSGNAEWNNEKYMGYITLARSARIMSAAYGEQIIISNSAYEYISNKIYETNQPIKSSISKKEISFRDLGDRRLKDVNQPVRIYQVVTEGLREDFPPLKTLDARPNNLPVQLTNFIGRYEELKTAKELLKFTRLLTITGSGGAGKTRFSLQTAADLIDDFANGVWFVELAAINDPEFLPGTILNIFGLKEESVKTPEQTLTEYLKDKDLLIILDNCEHLINACSDLVEKLLVSCPMLKIIATSREALNCSGEQTYRIPPLSQPDPKVNDSLEKLTQYESVRLFIERALSVNPGFRVTNENAAALAGICSRLDGIPLAIELAAARLKVLTVDKIYERLDDRFNLLTSGKRTALPRQQTLRALIDWSYDLLSEKEKILWNRLSVFSGGWTLDAAEHICSDGKLETKDILKLSEQLTEKSIIIFDFGNDRYRILESLKQYGNEKLAEFGNSDEIFLKHLNYFKELAESFTKGLEGSVLELWLERLELEHDNLLTAIDRSKSEKFSDTGAQIAWLLGNFWNIRGYYYLGRKKIGNILEYKDRISKPILIKVLIWAGILAEEQGDYEKALGFIEESLALSRESGDKREIATCLSELGILSRDKGDYEKARELIEESLKIRREIGNSPEIKSSLFNLGNLETMQGNLKKALKLHEENLELSRETGNKYYVAMSLTTLAYLQVSLENYEKAKLFFDESYKTNLAIGDKKGISLSLTGFGILAVYNRKFNEAKKYFEESISLSRDIGDKSGYIATLSELGQLEFENGNFSEAVKLHEENLVMSKTIGDKFWISKSFYFLGVIYFTKKDYKNSLRFFKENLILNFEIGIKYLIAESLIRIASVLNSEKRFTESLKILGSLEAEVRSEGSAVGSKEKKLFEDLKKDILGKSGDEDFHKHFEEGKLMNPKDAVQAVLKNL